MKTASGYLTLVIAIMTMISHVNANDRLSAEELIAQSPFIAIIEIPSVSKPQMNDASRNLEIFKQRIPARCIQSIKGEVPESFILENTSDSVLTAGKHLAFMRKLENDRYILTSSVSSRKINGNKVFWFNGDYEPLKSIIAKIEQISKASSSR